MTDLDKPTAIDYIALIKAAQEYGVLHLKIGLFEITMQPTVKPHVSQPSPENRPLLLNRDLPQITQVQNTATTATTDVGIRSKLEKLHATRKQFEDYRNMKPPGAARDEGKGNE